MAQIGNPGKGHVPPTNEAARVRGQIERGEVRADADAAREIAKKIEDQGGFWGPRRDGA